MEYGSILFLVNGRGCVQISVLVLPFIFLTCRYYSKTFLILKGLAKVPCAHRCILILTFGMSYRTLKVQNVYTVIFGFVVG